MSQDTSCSVRTSHASGSRSIQTEILNFPVNTYFRYHVTEYCAVIGTHSTVRGDKLLYGQIPDPFPRCGIGSGHARLHPYLEFSSRQMGYFHIVYNGKSAKLSLSLSPHMIVEYSSLQTCCSYTESDSIDQQHFSINTHGRTGLSCQHIPYGKYIMGIRIENVHSAPLKGVGGGWEF